MKSLLKVVKQPKVVKYSDVVSLDDFQQQLPPIEEPKVMVETEINKELILKQIEYKKNKANQMLIDAQTQADNILELARQKAQYIEDKKQKELEIMQQELIIKVRESALQEAKIEVAQMLDNTIDNLLKDVNQILVDTKAQLLDEMQLLHQNTHNLAIAIAEKILVKELDSGLDIEHLILAEVNKLKKQNVKHVIISDAWEKTTDNLKANLALIDIELDYEKQASDYMMLETEMGNYDISISTKLANVKQLFES